MLSSRPLRLALAGAGVLVLLALVWAGYRAWQVNRDLNDAVAQVDRFRAAVESGDEQAIDRELDALQDAAASAESQTSGPTWSLLTHVPVYGDDARGVRTVSRVVHDLSVDGLEPVVEVRDQLGELLPKDGAVPVETVAALEKPLARAERAMNDAETELAEEDPSGYTGRLEERYRDLQDQVGNAADAVTSARIAVDVLPSMLGSESERSYLLVFQNNAEIRATGGLPGSVALLNADDGALSIERQVAIGTFGRSDAPVLQMTEAERELYDEVPASFFQSANMTPDVPRAADLMRARWAEEFPQDHVDGVLLVDTVTLAYVLDATGPITVDGVELTGDNVVDELLNQTYLRHGTNEAQDAFYNAVATTAFERFTTGGGDGAGVVRALARATDERRVYVHSFHEKEQEQFAGTAISGDFVTDADVTEPQITVTINDTTGAKMSYYLRYEVDVRATYCTDGVQGFAAKARVTSKAPADAASLPDAITGGGVLLTDPGNQLVTLRVFAPVGGAIGDLELNAKPMDLIRVDQDGRPVGMTYLELEPGQTVDLAWTMRSGEGQTDAADLEITPTIAEADYATTLESACS